MGIKRAATAASVGVICIVMFGCAAPSARKSTQPRPAPPPQPEVRTAPLEMGRPGEARPLPPTAELPQAMPETPVRKEAPVVVALLEDVDRLQQQGDLDQAAARVERGLRIAPKDARLWQKLALIRLEQQRPQQAENMAKKSNSLSRGDYRMQAMNWRIIAQSRVQRGDMVGAERAKDRAAKYQ